jgi:hypothetical protein
MQNLNEIRTNSENVNSETNSIQESRLKKGFIKMRDLAKPLDALRQRNNNTKHINHKL